MKLPDFWVVLGVGAFGAFTVACGQFLQAQIAVRQVEAAIDAHDGDWKNSEVDDLVDKLSAVKSQLGMAAVSRGIVLDLLSLRPDADWPVIEEKVKDVLEVRPTSPAAWQALAQVRLAQGRPLADVLPAYRFSAEIASHEGVFMVQRVAMAIRYWDEWPEADRLIAIKDLVSLVRSDRLESSLRSIIDEQSPDVRDALRNALNGSGVTSAKTLARWGL